MIAGLETADTGTVSFDGEEVQHLHARRANVGFVFQHYALFRHMSVAENIEFGLRVRGVARDDRRAPRHRVADLMGLDGLGDRMPSQLSGGSANAWRSPALSRPARGSSSSTSRSPPSTRRSGRSCGSGCDGCTTSCTLPPSSSRTTRRKRSPSPTASSIINGGRLEQAGTPLEIMDHPATEFVARFVGEVNVLDGRIEDGGARVGALRVPIEDSRTACRSVS